MPNQNKRAAIYARSATKSQILEGVSGIDQQLALCRQYCTEHGYTLDEQHIYHEIAGGKGYMTHPQFTALRSAAKEHQFDVLIVFSVDRITRDLQYRAMILDELALAGITVESTDGHDQDGVAKFIQTITGYQAQMERQMIINRMQLGKAAKKAQRGQQQ